MVRAPKTLKATSRRQAELAGQLADRESRGRYLAQHLRAFLADQVRALRGEMSQKEFGERIGQPQSVVSRLENEEYGWVSMQALIDIATKLDIGLVVRFVDFPTFLDTTSDVSERAVAPAPYGTDPPIDDTVAKRCTA
jgi:transcriptional regulator with XRE-family HTH domain